MLYTPFIDVPAVPVAFAIWIYAPLVMPCGAAVVTVTVPDVLVADDIVVRSIQSWNGAVAIYGYRPGICLPVEAAVCPP